mgnify:CR=1 FL=1
MSKKKRINIDLPNKDSPEYKTIKFIAEWEGSNVKRFVEELVLAALKDRIDNNDMYAQFYEIAKSEL